MDDTFLTGLVEQDEGAYRGGLFVLLFTWHVANESETEVADQAFYLTQSQFTVTRPTSPRADPIMPGTWQGNHWSANF